MTEVRITSGHGMHDAQVLVDGEDITSKIMGIHIELTKGQFNQVAILLQPDVELNLQSDVTMVQQGIGSEFLDALDTSRLHNAACSMEWGDTEDLVSNVVALLKEALDGDQP